MLLGWHLIFTGYGFWLPNDPRGSGSSRVRAWHIFEVGGEATTVQTRHSVAHEPHDGRLRQAAKESLKWPPVQLTGIQARALGRGIANVCPKVELVIHACAILPDHVHVVAAAHKFNGDQLLACLKRAGTRGLNAEDLHPMKTCAHPSGRLPSPWAGGGWKVAITSAEQMQAAIRYVEWNPVKAGFKRQSWPFVVPFVEKCG
ncbi:MAG: hypothetical protein IT425_13945 [Pirellulales bacterium]|nr:hypothetical protein [Pirellulales bacterium]